MVRVLQVVRKDFLGNTRVHSIIFNEKPGFTAIRYFIYRILFQNTSIFRKLAILIWFRITAIFMHVKQRKIMRHKQNYNFCKNQIFLENLINLVKFLNQPCIMR